MSEMNPQDRPGSTPPSQPERPPVMVPVAQAPPPPPRRRRSRWIVPLVIIGVVVVVMVVGLWALGGVMAKLAGLDGDAQMVPSVYQAGNADEVIAVLEIKGIINDGQAALVNRFCRKIRKNKNVKAVLLRVQSPGGAVSPCDQIYEMLRLLKAGGQSDSGEDIPARKLVVSMGSVAASGGYYISVPADEIYAEPTTITGSIGVIGSVFVLKGAMEKVGVQAMLVRSTQSKAWKAAPNMFEEPAPYQMAALQKLIDDLHVRFQKVVTDERGGKIKAETRTKDYDIGGKTVAVTETSPYNGKVYLAADAKEIGLIDSIGYFQDAIDGAARLAELKKPKVLIYRVRRSLLRELGRARAPTISAKLLDDIQVPKVMMIWKVGG